MAMTKKEVAQAALDFLRAAKAQIDTQYAIKAGRINAQIEEAQKKVDTATDDSAAPTDYPNIG